MDTDATSVGDAADPTAALVRRAVAGDERAFGELYDAWSDRVYDRAYGVVRDHSLAAEVAQDTFLRAWQQLDTVRDPAVFGGWLLRIARNTALNRLRSERRTTAVDAEGLAMIERAGPSPASAPDGFRVEDRLHSADDPATAVEDAELVELVAEAAAALDGRDGEVLDLGLRLGLTPAEIGEAVGLTRNAANQAVHRARRHLRTAVQARVLWKRGRPDCPELAAALAAAGVERFGAAAVRVAEAHAAGCARCTEEQRLRLDPAVLFGAIPVVGAPPLLKARIAHALADAGVPMTGSTHATGGPAGGHGGSGGGSGPGGDPGGDPGRDPGGPTATAMDPAAVAPVAAPAPSPTGPRRGRRVALVAAAVVVVLAVTAGVVALVESPGGGEPRQGAAPATRPADLSPPVTGSIAVTPESHTPGWPMGPGGPPVLTWSSTNAAAVEVVGPGVSSTAPSGSLPLCPPAQTSGSFCPPTTGAYRYRLTLRDGSGAVVLTREVVLTVGP